MTLERNNNYVCAEFENDIINPVHVICIKHKHFDNAIFGYVGQVV